MKCLRFELCGKFAHFRRFYTNSSSLTYPIPPPTVVDGLLGAALGLDRSTYMDALERARYAIRPTSPWRTILQTINLLKVTSPGEVTGSKGHTQIPTQFVLPSEFDTELSYEIIVAHPEAEFVEQIEDALRRPVYPPFLGVAYCLGWFGGVEVVEGELMRPYEGEIFGSIQSSSLIDGFSPKEGQRVLRDRYPLSLHPSRKLEEADDILVEEDGKPLNAEIEEALQIGDRHYGLL